MIDQTRISAAPPTSGPQKLSPVSGGREVSPKPFDVAPETAVPADRSAEFLPAATEESDPSPVQADDKSAYEAPRHVTQGVMHEATGRYVIRVVASLNPDDVIAQYPPEDLLRFYELARELQGQSAAAGTAQSLAAV